MSKIRVIDLLNKIANGEKVPKKIKIPKTSPLTYNEKYKAYFNENNHPIPMLLADNLSNLNDRIEIIEEEPEIDIQKLEELNENANEIFNDKYGSLILENSLLQNRETINQLIKAVKKLDCQINK